MNLSNIVVSKSRIEVSFLADSVVGFSVISVIVVSGFDDVSEFVNKTSRALSLKLLLFASSIAVLNSIRGRHMTNDSFKKAILNMINNCILISM
jgi:hypothetical protein